MAREPSPDRPWSTQLRKGLVELTVLAALRGVKEAYGYELLQRINALPGFELTESTVYPMLAKLSKDGLLNVRVGPSPHGPPRRYYALTAPGRKHLKHMSAEWSQLNASIQSLLDGDAR
ncbi:MAG: PadR family transcriptional regulator [Planctomycetota bacterium]